MRYDCGRAVALGISDGAMMRSMRSVLDGNCSASAELLSGMRVSGLLVLVLRQSEAVYGLTLEDNGCHGGSPLSVDVMDECRRF